MIEIGIYLINEINENYDECFFVNHGIEKLKGTGFENCNFINFKNENFVFGKLVEKYEYINGKDTKIMIAALSIEDFFFAEPYLY